MKHKSKLLLILVLIVVTSTSYIGTSYATSIDNAKSEKTQLEKKKEAMQGKIAELEKEKGNIITYIEKLDIQLNELTKEIEKLSSQIIDAQEELVLTEEELQVAKETVKNQYATMKKRIKYIYENGTQDYFELILKAEDISSLLNRAEYIAKISEFDKNLLNDFQVAKQLVADKETELKAKIAELNELNEAVAFEKETVTKLVNSKTEELSKYEDNINQSQAMVAEYNASIEEQENLIEELLEQERIKAEQARKRAEEEKRRREQEAANNNSNNQNNNSNNNSNNQNNNSSNDAYSEETGSFRWPLQISGTITSYFGYREAPTQGASTYHKGIDIAAPTGTPIVASGAGTVVTASYQSAAGNYIMLSHGNGIYTVYMHCSKLAVSVGQNVTKGEVIGYVGSTGVSTGPHLHFGVSVNGTYVDPLKYVSR